VSCSPVASRAHGRRDKARLKIGDQTILERVLARMRPQCEHIIINANGDASRFADTGLPVIADDVAGFAGPLAGILAGLDWVAREAPGIKWVASVPGDCPFLPFDLLPRLHAARIAAIHRSPARAQVNGDIRWSRYGPCPYVRSTARGGRRRLAQDRDMDGAPRRRHRRLPTDPVDPFFNVNSPEDLAAATKLAALEPTAT